MPNNGFMTTQKEHYQSMMDFVSKTLMGHGNKGPLAKTIGSTLFLSFQMLQGAVGAVAVLFAARQILKIKEVANLIPKNVLEFINRPTYLGMNYLIMAAIIGAAASISVVAVVGTFYSRTTPNLKKELQLVDDREKEVEYRNQEIYYGVQFPDLLEKYAEYSKKEKKLDAIIKVTQALEKQFTSETEQVIKIDPKILLNVNLIFQQALLEAKEIAATATKAATKAAEGTTPPLVGVAAATASKARIAVRKEEVAEANQELFAKFMESVLNNQTINATDANKLRKGLDELKTDLNAKMIPLNYYLTIENLVLTLMKNSVKDYNKSLTKELADKFGEVKNNGGVVSSLMKYSPVVVPVLGIASFLSASCATLYGKCTSAEGNSK